MHGVTMKMLDVNDCCTSEDVSHKGQQISLSPKHSYLFSS